jgi:FAD/FMN-containing dehydrogenase
MYIPFSGISMCIAHDETQAADTPRAADESDDGIKQLKALRDYLSWFPALRKRLLALAISGAPEENVVGESWNLLSSERNVLFNEMEYHLPSAVGLEALEEVRAYIEKNRADVFFPFEARMTQGDENWLSPFHDGRKISIAVHCYHQDDYAFLFSDIEPIFRKYGGRPHWGKLNSLTAADFDALYPQWQAFAALRQRLDPQGRFLNPYLRALFAPTT